VGPGREIKTNQGSEGVDFVPPTPITGVNAWREPTFRLQHIQIGYSTFKK